jgi:hypothetical protein
MPHLVRPLFDPNGLRLFFLIVPIEEAQLYSGGILREQCEVYPFAIPGCP